ncbi:hypothetical protein ACLOJK_040152 [Asimina triloba]
MSCVMHVQTAYVPTNWMNISPVHSSRFSLATSLNYKFTSYDLCHGLTALEVEFRASCSLTSVRTSRVLPELSNMYSPPDI